MGYLQHRANLALNSYRRKGGKQNRRKQVAMAIRFVRYLESVERVKDWEHLSKRHVIRFYKANRHLSGGTIANYYYAICQLCESIGSGLEVPRPKLELHRSGDG